MKYSRAIAGAAFALVFGLSGCGSQEEATVAKGEVDSFHKLWNAGEFKAVYDDAHWKYRNSQTDEQAVAALERMKRTYGEFKSATLRSSTLSPGQSETDQNETDLTLKYESVFERGSAVEIFVYRTRGDQALLISYDVMSPEAAKKRASEKEDVREAERKSMEEKLKAEAARTPNS